MSVQYVLQWKHPRSGAGARLASRVALASLLMALLGIPSLAVAQELEMTIEHDTLEIEGATPFGDVMVFGVVLTGGGYVNYFSTVSQVLPASARGETRFFLKKGPPRRAIFVAIDMEGGSASVAKPEAYPVQQTPLSKDALLMGKGEHDAVLMPTGYYEALVTRPGVGAWRLSASDGGPGDADGLNNAVVTLSLADMKPMREKDTAAPSRFTRDDLIVIINRSKMDLFVARVGQEEGKS